MKLTIDPEKCSVKFNEQALQGFNAIHLNLLMAICCKARDKGTEKVTFTFNELRHLAGLGAYHLADSALDEKLGETFYLTNKIILSVDNVASSTTLFTRCTRYLDKRTLEVTVNSDFSFLLNDLSANFTRFELEEFTHLKSKYAKECYRRLKQFRSTGVWRVSLDDFKRLLDVPAKFGAGYVNKYVLARIEKELTPLLGLKVERIYQKGRRGRPSLQALKLTFKPKHFENQLTQGLKAERTNQMDTTQKNKTLNELINWCRYHVQRIEMKTPGTKNAGFLIGQRYALNAVIGHCEAQLDYLSIADEYTESEKAVND